MDTVVSVLIGGGLFAFIQFLINRHDNKNDRLKAVTEAVNKLSARIDDLDGKIDQTNAITARVRILRFADEMQENKRHSKDSWDQCMSDITDYEDYCNDHPKFRNNQTSATIEYLTTQYKERLDKHDWS